MPPTTPHPAPEAASAQISDQESRQGRPPSETQITDARADDGDASSQSKIENQKSKILPSPSALYHACLTSPDPILIADHLHLTLPQLQAALDTPDIAAYLDLRLRLANLHTQALTAQALAQAIQRLIALLDTDKPEVARRACMAIIDLARTPGIPAPGSAAPGSAAPAPAPGNNPAPGKTPAPPQAKIQNQKSKIAPPPRPAWYDDDLDDPNYPEDDEDDYPEDDGPADDATAPIPAASIPAAASAPQSKIENPPSKIPTPPTGGSEGPSEAERRGFALFHRPDEGRLLQDLIDAGQVPGVPGLPPGRGFSGRPRFGATTIPLLLLLLTIFSCGLLLLSQMLPSPLTLQPSSIIPHAGGGSRTGAVPRCSAPMLFRTTGRFLDQSIHPRIPWPFHRPPKSIPAHGRVRSAFLHPFSLTPPPRTC